MFTYKQQGNVIFVRVHKLCMMCCRMMCLNEEKYTIFQIGETHFYKHQQCPGGPHDAMRKLQ